MELSDLEQGLIVGVLISEGHFGGDGKQPQITVRMHVRREALARWLVARLPRTRLYGPYHHSGRSYYQWMARGAPLVEDVLPILERHVSAELDGHAHGRLGEMTTAYAPYIARIHRRRALLQSEPDGPSSAPAASGVPGPAPPPSTVAPAPPSDPDDLPDPPEAVRGRRPDA